MNIFTNEMPEKLREEVEKEIDVFPKTILIQKDGKVKVAMWTVVLGNDKNVSSIIKIIKYYSETKQCERLTISANDLIKIIKNFGDNKNV